MSGIPTRDEMRAAREWFEQSFQTPVERGEGGRLPLSFRYRDEDSAELLSNWDSVWSEGDEVAGATRHVLALTDRESGLQVRCEVTLFDDFPAVEWVAHFRNTGEDKSPIIADILPLDVAFDAAPDAPCRLHHAKGSDCKLDDFAPLVTELGAPSELQLAPVLGRSSNGALPFFNLERGEGGVILAIGWTGGWSARFECGEGGEIRLRAGMKTTHLKLLPGEEIRTPRILLLFWEGERVHGHNMLRQFILAHHTPRPRGELLQAPLCNAVWGENNDYNQIAKARWWKENDIPLDIFWIDAGWHGDAAFREDSTVFNSGWGGQVGNWWPNKTTYPDGLKPVGDALREMGFGFCLWLEPERVFKDTRFARERPEWLFGPIGDNYLFNLGNSQARQGLGDIISGLIEEGGVTCYRQDFNTDPAPFWEAADAPDRVGMSEIRHIEGLYALWDELLERHPGLIIDNCSSGGRRIDLETISRSIPLWRSDFQCWEGFDPIAMQGQTHGLAMWVPLSTGCCDQPDTYAFRSALGPGMVLATNLFEREPCDHFPPDWLRRMVAEQREVQKYFYGDFYPLIEFGLSDDIWAAWQFHRPDLGEGMVVALRRPRSPYTHIKVALHGLEPDARYELRDMDGGKQAATSGRELMDDGLSIGIEERPGSALFLYTRVA